MINPTKSTIWELRATSWSALKSLNTARTRLCLAPFGCWKAFANRHPPENLQCVHQRGLWRHATPQNETSSMSPQSPYAAAKLCGYQICRIYREGFGMWIANGILFNHESPRRGETFVTRKITQGAARIKLGIQEKLALGNLQARRDWGYAPEYVDAMWRMLQQQKPDDYVVATGESHSVQEFIEEAFGYLGMDWRYHVTMIRGLSGLWKWST